MSHLTQRPTRVLSVLGFLSLAAAVIPAISCAAGPASSSAGSAGSTAAPSSRYFITESDLARNQDGNLYDAIKRLRPEFLRGRSDRLGFMAENPPGGGGGVPASGTSASAQLQDPPAVMVYKDNVRLSGVDDLRQIQVSTVREVRYLNGTDAAVKFGTNNAGGAILITSK